MGMQIESRAACRLNPRISAGSQARRRKLRRPDDSFSKPRKSNGGSGMDPIPTLNTLTTSPIPPALFIKFMIWAPEKPAVAREILW